jgi:tetratricopeptide (TPR) repeat protein
MAIRQAAGNGAIEASKPLRNAMRNRLKLVAVIAAVCGGWAVSQMTLAADQPAGPAVSRSVAKQLKAAQDAVVQKHFDEALGKINEAKAASGEKTAYDNYVIDVILIQIYQGKNDISDLVQTLGAAAQSQYVTNEQQKTWYKFIAQYYYQQKDYPKSLDAAEQALHHGAVDADTQGLIAKAQYQSGKYKDAEQTQADLVSKQERPDEESLKLMWQFAIKAQDDAGAGKALERLVALYPKPDYWANALAPLVRMDIKDSHLQLDVYRLMKDVGVLRLPTDYAEMAEIALDQGFPGETVATLQEAFQKNIFTEQRDKDRYQHLLDGAKQRAATDQQQIGKTEPQDGNALVQLGAAYMSYGQYDKAISNINKGLQKGGLKSVDEANLLLGIAQLRAKNTAEAQRAFDKVATSTTPGYARLGKLWALHAGAH